jgi:hypothetical protein
MFLCIVLHALNHMPLITSLLLEMQFSLFLGKWVRPKLPTMNKIILYLRASRINETRELTRKYH